MRSIMESSQYSVFKFEIQVNARTINDVTVSPDGRYAVMSREGASNRVNGVVILDLANRGVDVLRVANGRIAEKLSYVKG